MIFTGSCSVVYRLLVSSLLYEFLSSKSFTWSECICITCAIQYFQYGNGVIMKILVVIICGIVVSISGCGGDKEKYITYKNVDSSLISTSDLSRYVIETCVDIYRENQNQEFNPRYSVSSVHQTGQNNIVEVSMTEVRYVQGSRQEQSKLTYCSRFSKGETDTIYSHRYLDTLANYLVDKKYSTFKIEI